MSDLKDFREILKDFMIENDLKSDELARKLDVSGQTIRAWLSNTQNISLSNAVKIADYFACSIDFLVGATETVLDFKPQDCPEFYSQFRKILEEKGVTRYALSKNTKIKDSYFTTWQNGTQPTLLSVMEIADYLDCSIDYLIGRSEI